MDARHNSTRPYCIVVLTYIQLETCDYLFRCFHVRINHWRHMKFFDEMYKSITGKSSVIWNWMKESVIYGAYILLLKKLEKHFKETGSFDWRKQECILTKLSNLCTMIDRRMLSSVIRTNNSSFTHKTSNYKDYTA